MAEQRWWVCRETTGRELRGLWFGACNPITNPDPFAMDDAPVFDEAEAPEIDWPELAPDQCVEIEPPELRVKR